MLLNEPAPDFALPDLNGDIIHLSDLKGKIVILNFWSCECPHSERTDRDLMAMVVQWQADVVLLPVAANQIETPEAVAQAASGAAAAARPVGRGHAVADLYEAQTTPHIFVIDRQGILRYMGAVDDTSFRQRRPTRFYVDEAVEALLDGRLPEVSETPAYGCAIVREALE